MEGLVFIPSFADLWLTAIDGAEVGIVLAYGYSIVLQMLVDVPWLLVLKTVTAAVDDLLLGKGDEGLSKVKSYVLFSEGKHVLLVDFEFHGCSHSEDMRAIVMLHVLHWRYEISPIIVIIVLEFSNFQEGLAFGQGSHNMVQFLELSFI